MAINYSLSPNLNYPVQILIYKFVLTGIIPVLSIIPLLLVLTVRVILRDIIIIINTRTRTRIYCVYRVLIPRSTLYYLVILSILV